MPPAGFKPHSQQATAADPRLKPHGYWNRLWTL